MEPMKRNCTVCGGEFEYVKPRSLDASYLGMETICPACNKKRNDKREAERAAEEAPRIAEERKLYWESMWGPRYRESDLDRLPHPQFDQVMAWQYGERGLLLVGPTGTAKTRCLVLLTWRLMVEGRRVRVYGGVDFGHACEQEFMSGGGPEWARRLGEVEVLVLDDLGKIKLTDRAEAELYGIIERRYGAMKPTLTTTNDTGDTLAERMTDGRGPAIIRRLRETSEVIVFPATAGRPAPTL